MARATACTGRDEDGAPCLSPTTDASRRCPEHRDREGFAGRFARAAPHPVHRSWRWRMLARRTVEAWVREHGWTCPGWRRPPHPVSPGGLAAAHPVGLALGGEAFPERLGVLCGSCNARQGLSERRRRPGGDPPRRR